MTFGIETKISPEDAFDRASAGLWTAAAGYWYRLYAPYVPRDTGRLAGHVIIGPEEGGASIRHAEPYAARVYASMPVGWDRMAEPRLPELADLLRAALREGGIP
ncbi:MAG: hypothetical protein IJH78_03100 [Clostridia bacterium]|nr:hypothetical protein [Clostridia bacterium]